MPVQKQLMETVWWKLAASLVWIFIICIVVWIITIPNVPANNQEVAVLGWTDVIMIGVFLWLWFHKST